MFSTMTSADDSALSSFVERLGFFFSDSNLRRDKWMRAKLDESGGLTLDDLLSFNTIKTISTDKALLAKAAEDADLKDLISYDAEKEVISRRVKFDRETAGDGHELSIVVQNLPLTTPPPEEEKAADDGKAEEEKKAAEDGKSEEEKKDAEDCKPVFKPRYAVNRDEVKALFEPYGKVGIVQLRWAKKHHDRDDDKHAGQDGSRGYGRGESYPLGMAFVEFQNADGMNAACADLIADKADVGDEKKKESGEGDEAKAAGGEAPRPKTTLELKGNALKISRKKPPKFRDDRKRDGPAKRKRNDDGGGGGPPEKQFEPMKVDRKPGCIISLAGLSAEKCDRESIREAVSATLGVSTDVKSSGLYVDYSRSDTEGYLRLVNGSKAEEMKELVSKINDGSIKVADEKAEAKVLEGEEESAYYDKLEEFLNKRKRAQFEERNEKRQKGGRGYRR